MIKLLLFAAVMLGSCNSAQAEQDEWNLARLEANYSSGIAEKVPWVGYWWPYNSNGIASGRFNRSGISPAKKIDRLFSSGGEAVEWEYYNHGRGRPGVNRWWGHCNGWAVASILEEEPREGVTVDGTFFTVSDRKALLSEYWAENASEFFGDRVYGANDYSSAAFWDVVPAQFHIVLANVLGREGKSFAIDRYTGVQVWNQPLVAYRTFPIRPRDYLGPDPRYPNIFRVNVTTTIWWANDMLSPSALTPPFRWVENAYFKKRTLRYELWVDGPLKFDSSGGLVSSGDIILTDRGIGGRWKNGVSGASLNNTHPDFMWIPFGYAQSTGRKNPHIHDDWIRDNIAE